jgi:hypothetical protein
MLRRIRELGSYRLIGADGGDFGFADDFYFDDQWTLRYLVTRTGRRDAPEQFLISPLDIRHTDTEYRAMYVASTGRSVAVDGSLRSARTLIGHRVHSSVDAIGHLEDLLVDDETWTLRHLIVGSQNWWWFGRKVLISSQWVQEVWPEGKVLVGLCREEIEQGLGWETPRLTSPW